MNKPAIIFASELDPDRLEKAYLNSRKREGWFYDDESVRVLPNAGFPLDQAKIWNWRRRSLARLVTRIKNSFGRNKFSILDVGCGNGWMSHFLASRFELAQVFGVDVNLVELEQAARVFSRSNLKFGYADILSQDLPEHSFNLIVLAGSAQYFSDLRKLQKSLLRLLAPSGEVHIIDTNFYQDLISRNTARDASVEYFNKQGTPEMIQFYHHHLISDWRGDDLNKHWVTKLLQRFGVLAPFPWLFFRATENSMPG